MASLSEIVEQEVVASPRGKLSITSESSLASVASLSMPLIQEIVLSADIKCSDCQEKIADIMSRMIEAETYSILVSVLEKKVTLTCTYSGDRRVSKSYGEALLCKMSTFKRRILHSSRKQLNVE
ncbi:hypothetical protein HID58_046916 [Brassica napus]|uniref:HMA domain-containing protein n=1 Tax=Brassica napus TaxID=3708 RepID=A0ABQ8AXY5_BRANA|nr:PREDICTED: uncharacterized protein LOC106325398 isoform X1 [Brassica oleracea var. oleracea]XP_022552193.2 uncharacterized protein LOC106442519 isoform X1 [Brassica napus]KAH0897348.1 hypothetical protein HID58_046916 [Brassica napus]